MQRNISLALFQAGIIAMLLVALAVVTLRSYDAHHRAVAHIEKLRSALNGGIFSYGTLISYDQSSRTVTLSAPNRYEPTGASEEVRYVIADNAYIGFQEILGGPGASQLTPPEKKSLEEFAAAAVGTHVKFFITLTKDGYRILYLLYGDPL